LEAPEFATRGFFAFGGGDIVGTAN
jgi:hypothetical protein